MTSSSRPRRARLWLVLCGVAAAGILLGLRLAQLQLTLHETLAKRAERNAVGRITIPGPRGRIVDRRGHALAISVPTHVLLAVPAEISRRGLRALERAAGTPGRLVGRADRERWIPVTQDCDAACDEKVQSLIDLGIVPERAVHREPAFTRRYPLGSMAAHVLGFVNREGTPDGAERRFDDLLRGEQRQILLLRDAFHKALGTMEAAPAAPEPATVMLTIDSRIQQVLERALREAVERHAARGAMGVVLDPRSGEVLGMASYPCFDPNCFSRGVAHHRNAALGAAFEPGSVVKPLTAAALLESGVIQPGRAVFCGNGSWVWEEGGGRPVRDHHPHGWLTLPQVLEVSSNIGIARFSLALEPAALHRVLTRFGFGRRTGIDLPAEEHGQLRAPTAWRGRDRLAVSFGHSFSVTTLQLAVAYGALAQGGVLRPPHVGRSWRQAGGDWRPLPRDRAPVRAVSQRTAGQISRWLEAVVAGEHGTGRRAAVPGYRVAGKTGTAEKAGADGYDRRRNVSTFAGFAPAADPAVVVVISIDEPSKNGRDAGSTAAPAFSLVMAESLRILRVPPDSSPAPLALTARASTRSRP